MTEWKLNFRKVVVCEANPTSFSKKTIQKQEEGMPSSCFRLIKNSTLPVFGSGTAGGTDSHNEAYKRKNVSVLWWTLTLVRATGLEPAQPCDHKNLNLTRLPIPPRPLVRETGLEPVRCKPHAPQTCASASSATLAYSFCSLVSATYIIIHEKSDLSIGFWKIFQKVFRKNKPL